MYNRILMPVLVVLLSGAMLGCSKSKPSKDDIIPSDTPFSSVPESLNKGSWFTGTLSAISFFDRDGHHLGNEYEAGQEFQFYEDSQGRGCIKFWQYLGLRTSVSCTTEIFTTKEGTVKFDAQTFTFYPTKGCFRTVKDKCSSGSGTVIREAGKDDLVPVSHRWQIKKIDGKEYLYTYPIEDQALENVLFVFECTEY